MISFFQKNKNVDHAEWLSVDMHNHLLPHLDDGATCLEQSVSFINNLTELGFSQFICTPHIFTELYPNTKETIFPALSQTQTFLNDAGSRVRIQAAAEYMIDETFETSKDLICLPGKHILIEMSYMAEMKSIEQVIFDLQVSDYKVILAHPERYFFYHTKTEKYQRLKNMGVLFQLNLLSLSGFYGKEVAHIANFLLKKKWYDFAGTDLHHQQHLNELKSIITSGNLYRMIGHYPFRNKELVCA